MHRNILYATALLHYVTASVLVDVRFQVNKLENIDIQMQTNEGGRLHLHLRREAYPMEHQVSALVSS